MLMPEFSIPVSVLAYKTSLCYGQLQQTLLYQGQYARVIVSVIVGG